MDAEQYIQQGERLDDLQLSGLHILQKPGSFLFGTDSVLLAFFAKAGYKSRVLDLGTGNGILPLLLWGRYRPRYICGMEIQPAAAGLAARNMRMNGLENVDIICGDYTHHDTIPGRGSYDVVVANPPYSRAGSGKQSVADENAIARHELHATLDDVVAAAAAALKQGGKLYMVHKPERLAEIFACMGSHGLQPKAMQAVQARADKPPTLVLVKGMKQAAAGLMLHPPLVMYDEAGGYTPQMKEIYKHE